MANNANKTKLRKNQLSGGGSLAKCLKLRNKIMASGTADAEKRANEAFRKCMAGTS